MTAPLLVSSQQTYHRRWVVLIALLPAAAAAWAFARWRPFRVEIVGSSMAPVLLPGDWAIAASSEKPARGRVVVVRHPDRRGMEMVKRVTGVPGDEVHPGRILGADEWFVAGDNPGRSTDSRTFGPVSGAAIAGRVRFVYWPPGRIGAVR